MDPNELLARTQWDTFWVPDDVTVTARPSAIYLSCPRDLPSLNVVLHCSAASSELPAFVAEVAQAHAGRESRFMVGPLFPGAPLDAALEAAGYGPADLHYGYVHEAAALARGLPKGIEVRPVTDVPSVEDWYRVAERAFGTARPVTPSEQVQVLAECTRPGARVYRSVAYDTASGAPISSGGLSLFPDLGIGLLFAGGTVPDARGRGAYTAVLADRAAHATSRGIPLVGLYARHDTSAPIVANLGFRRLREMRYWVRPGATS